MHGYVSVGQGATGLIPRLELQERTRSHGRYHDHRQDDPNGADRPMDSTGLGLGVGCVLPVASDLRRTAIDEQLDAVDEAAVI